MTFFSYFRVFPLSSNSTSTVGINSYSSSLFSSKGTGLNDLVEPSSPLSNKSHCSAVAVVVFPVPLAPYTLALLPLNSKT